jgi:endonuclease YncB( thermonuclease family)
MGGSDQLCSKVSGVTNGDTIEVEAHGRATPGHLIRVPTPETVAPDQPIGCFGKEASAYTRTFSPTDFSHEHPREFEGSREAAQERSAGLWGASPEVDSYRYT